MPNSSNICAELESSDCQDDTSCQPKLPALLTMWSDGSTALNMHIHQ